MPKGGQISDSRRLKVGSDLEFRTNQPSEGCIIIIYSEPNLAVAVIADAGGKKGRKAACLPKFFFLSTTEKRNPTTEEGGERKNLLINK